MPPVKIANPFSFLFLFLLILFGISCVIIFSPIILILLFVLLFYAVFARERLSRANRKFRESPFVHRYFHTRADQRTATGQDPDVVDADFTVVEEDDPGTDGRSR